MARVTFLHYIYKDTPLHRMDGRLKMLCMLLLTISVSMATRWQQYIISMCVISLALVVSKLPIITTFKRMKFFAVMVVIILIMGDSHFAGQLVLMMMISTVMAGTTPLFTIRDTIEWFLRPIPLIPEVRIATIINLTFVLIPVIFDNYLEMMDAQKARCIALRQNPIKRIKFIVFPLLSRTLRRVDSLVYAMESRCYSETRTRAIFKTSKADWLILMICVVVFIIVTL